MCDSGTRCDAVVDSFSWIIVDWFFEAGRDLGGEGLVRDVGVVVRHLMVEAMVSCGALLGACRKWNCDGCVQKVEGKTRC